LVVKIADDFGKVVFSNGKEHYMLNGTSQDNFPWIKDKFLRYVLNHDGRFYLACSKDYDRDIDILDSENQNFNASLDYKIEPGLMEVFDAVVDTNAKDKAKGMMKILTKIGDFLYLDYIDIEKANKGDSEESEQESEAVLPNCIEKHYSAYGFNWPYFSYATKNNRVFIYNAFNPKFI
jgi:hypothetical protein